MLSLARFGGSDEARRQRTIAWLPDRPLDPETRGSEVLILLSGANLGPAPGVSSGQSLAAMVTAVAPAGGRRRLAAGENCHGSESRARTLRSTRLLIATACSMRTTIRRSQRVRTSGCSRRRENQHRGQVGISSSWTPSAENGLPGPEHRRRSREKETSAFSSIVPPR